MKIIKTEPAIDLLLTDVVMGARPAEKVACMRDLPTAAQVSVHASRLKAARAVPSRMQWIVFRAWR